VELPAVRLTDLYAAAGQVLQESVFARFGVNQTRGLLRRSNPESYSSAVIARQNGAQTVSSDLTESMVATFFSGYGFSHLPR
jgi:hypothetical protein